MQDFVRGLTIVILSVTAGVVAETWFFRYYLPGPKAADSILYKKGTALDYKYGSLPCPGYEKPIIKFSEDKALADCDGDGWIDEINSPKPYGEVDPLVQKQWTFVLRPGVTQVKFKNLREELFAFGIYMDANPYSSQSQLTFLWLKIRAKIIHP